MQSIKKGTDPKRPAPKPQPNYSRVSNVCLALSIVGMIVAFVCHFKNMETLMFFAFGVAFASAIIHVSILNSEEESDDDE